MVSTFSGTSIPLSRLSVPIAREVQAVIGEALFNAQRHSHATSIAIEATRGARAIRICIRDNGIGLPPDVLAQGERERHFGLIGMRERAAQIDGQFTIANPITGGLEIALSVPFRPKGLKGRLSQFAAWLWHRGNG
jgi:signal transduction histidine kinase